MPVFAGPFCDLLPAAWLFAQSEESAWHRLVSNPHSVALMAVFGSLTLIILVPTLAHYWYATRAKQWEVSLKQAMIERGMSAEDIKSVLEAGGKVK